MQEVKTLHLTNSWHSKSGGVSTFYRALMDAANGCNRRVTLVVPAAEDGVKEYGPCCRIYSIESPTSPYDPNYRVIMPGAFLGKRSPLARILDKESPDLVEVCDKYTLAYAGGLLRQRWLAGHRPTVVALTCERMDENVSAYVSRSPAAKALSKVYLKWLYFPLADHHIAVTERTADELREAARGHKVRRGVWVAPMGVDTDTFNPERRSVELRRDLLASLDAPESSLLLLYAGRLAPEKNTALLLETLRVLDAAGHSRFHLVIAGEGPLRQSLEECARAACPGRVHFLGHVGNRERLASLFANCDVFVHPNPREPFGIAPLEAMASGLPLVAPETGGVRTYAGLHNAWLAPAGPRAYADACADASTPAQDRDMRVANALATARSFSWDRVCASYFRLYDELHACRLTGRAPSRPPEFYSSPGNLFGMEKDAQTRGPGVRG